MTRRCGRSRRGTRLVAKVPHRRWRTLTFLAALRCDRIEAPCVIEGPIKVAGYVRYALGEGIEKATSDFAAEVAAAGGTT